MNKNIAKKKNTKIITRKLARKTEKKVNLSFEKAVRTAMLCSVLFSVMHAVWSIIAYGFIPLNFGIVILMGLFTFLLFVAHKKGNQRLVDGLSAVVAMLVFITQTIVVFTRQLPAFSTDIVATAIMVLDFLMMGLLLTFVVVHFASATRESKGAIFLNNRINFFILLLSVCLMVLYAAFLGVSRSIELVEVLCYYCMVIAVTDVVQRLEEGK